MTLYATMDAQRPRNLPLGGESRGALTIGSLAAHAVGAATRLLSGSDLTIEDEQWLDTVATVFETAARAIDVADSASHEPADLAVSVTALQAMEFEMEALAGLSADSTSGLADLLRDYATRTRSLMTSPSAEDAEQAVSIFTRLSELALSRLGTSGEIPTTL